jgi:uncharacterized membrane protein
MEKLSKAGRIFYGTAITATGCQQFFFRDIFRILFPPLPLRFTSTAYFSIPVAVFLLVAGAAVALNIKAKYFAFALGCLFLFFFIFCYLPYQFFISPYSSRHLGVWINALKEFAYAGGAFTIAGQALLYSADKKEKPGFSRWIAGVAPYGPLMFSITMISFGVSHFYYTETVENMVPIWIPAHQFWTYFAGISLIASGISIIFHFRISLLGNLLGIMIFLWFIILHIPGALASPLSDNGNEVTSAFSALAFSGIAFVIANRTYIDRKARVT